MPPRYARSNQPRLSFERIAVTISATACALGLAAIAVSGWTYFLAPGDQRVYSAAHELFGPAEPIGLICGITALVLFASNFGYLVRKELSWMDRIGSLRYWLDWHVASGILGCGFVAFHCGLEMRNWIAQASVYALGVVIATGLVGRYLLRFVPRTNSGARADVDTFEDGLLELVDEARHSLVEHPDAIRAIQALIDDLEQARDSPSLPDARSIKSVLTRLRQARARIRVIEEALAHHAGGRMRARVLRVRMARASRQVAVVHVAGRMMDAWRAFHRAFALLLLCAIIAHVGIAIYYGYGAFWR